MVDGTVKMKRETASSMTDGSPAVFLFLSIFTKNQSLSLSFLLLCFTSCRDACGRLGAPVYFHVNETHKLHPTELANTENCRSKSSEK